MPIGIIAAGECRFAEVASVNTTSVAKEMHKRVPWRIGKSIYTGGMTGVLRKSVPMAAIAFILIAGCRSAHVEATVVNSGNTMLHNIEVDYPSASFGISSLAPGAEFHYKLKLQDAGRMKVQFFDSNEKEHSGKGPYATQGQHGTVTITLDGTGKNVWTVNLHPAVTAPKGE